jgi:hypothetical protein
LPAGILHLALQHGMALALLFSTRAIADIDSLNALSPRPAFLHSTPGIFYGSNTTRTSLNRATALDARQSVSEVCLRGGCRIHRQRNVSRRMNYVAGRRFLPFLRHWDFHLPRSRLEVMRLTSSRCRCCSSCSSSPTHLQHNRTEQIDHHTQLTDLRLRNKPAKPPPPSSNPLSNTAEWKCLGNPARDAHCAQVCAKCLPCPLQGWELRTGKVSHGFRLHRSGRHCDLMVFVIIKEVRRRCEIPSSAVCKKSASSALILSLSAKIDRKSTIILPSLDSS